MKQTAVEWLVENVIISAPLNWDTTILEQAKEMEKEQIINALMTSEVELLAWGISAEKYYNETFKSE